MGKRRGARARGVMRAPGACAFARFALLSATSPETFFQVADRMRRRFVHIATVQVPRSARASPSLRAVPETRRFFVAVRLPRAPPASGMHVSRRHGATDAGALPRDGDHRPGVGLLTVKKTVIRFRPNERRQRKRVIRTNVKRESRLFHVHRKSAWGGVGHASLFDAERRIGRDTRIGRCGCFCIRREPLRPCGRREREDRCGFASTGLTTTIVH